MLIFFTCSKAGIRRYWKHYKKVLKELRGLEIRVESTYGKSYLNTTPDLKKIGNLTYKEDSYKYIHDHSVKAAIFRCDAVIIEATYPSFRLGFEAFTAITQQKPVLVLSRTRNFGNLIDHTNFFGARYTEFTLPDEIEKFLRHVKKHKLRNRFNLFISDEQKRKLEKSSKLLGGTMSDYVRRLIDNDTNFASKN